MIESIPVNFGAIRYFLDMLRHKPEHNTLVVGKQFDSNKLFAVALVDDAKIAGFETKFNPSLAHFGAFSS